MKQEYNNELTPEQREKMSKNLVYIGIFSIVMIFAGLTSAYIVQMGDQFWVKYPFPTPFWISTVCIALSSIVLWAGIRMAVKGNPNGGKIGTVGALVLGIAFAFFQFQGYGKLFEAGANPVSDILVMDGRYGDYFQLKINGKYMEIDGNDYVVAGKVLNEKEKAGVSEFAKQFEHADTKFPSTVKGYRKYTLLYKNREVTIKDNKLFVADTQELLPTDLYRLTSFSWHLRDGRGDFFHRGKYGKDFQIYYKGKALDYKNRDLYFNGRKLDAPMQLKLNNAPDQATAYLWIITILHLLHVLVTLIYMLRMSIRSFTGRLEANNYIGIRSGAIFWHFLGLLWGYLLLFLLFIH